MKKKPLLFCLLFVLMLPLLILVGCSGFNENNNNNNNENDNGDFDYVGEKIEITESNITKDAGMFNNSCTYTGEPITLNLNNLEFRCYNRKIALSEFEFTYENNVDAGTASLVITCKDSNPYLYGTLKKEFNIKHKSEFAYSLDELREKLIKNYIVGARDIVIPKGETLEIPQGAILYLVPQVEESTAKFENYGTLINNGEFEFGTTSRSTSYGFETRYNFLNEGKFVNNGKFVVAGTGKKTGFNLVKSKFFQSGIFENNGSVTNNGGNIFADEEFDVESLNNGEFTLRTPISREDVRLTTGQYNRDVLMYGMTFVAGEACVPNVSIAGKEIEAYEIRNNDHAGTAEVYIKAATTNENVYGEITVTFTIEKGVVENITSYEMLKSYMDDGDFGTFKCDKTAKIVIPKGETFTIEDDERIYLPSLSIEGNLTNNGRLVVEFVVNTFGTFVLSEGSTLKNSGTIEVNDSTEIYGEIINDGHISIASYRTLFKDGSSIVNKENGTIDFQRGNSKDDYLVFENLNIENKGEISMDVKMFCFDAFTKFENVTNGFTSSSGHIWSFHALDKVSNNIITVYKRLSEVEITLFEKLNGVEVVYDDGIDYDTEEHKLKFKVEGSELNANLYTASYTYDDEDSSEHFSKAGTINLTINIKEKQECAYGGSVTVSYKILKSEFLAATSDDLARACADKSYSKIVLNKDIYLSTSTTLVEGGVIDTNNHKLTLYASLTNYGSIIISNDFNGELTTANCDLWIKNGALLSNYGTIENNGLILAERVYKTEFVGGLISDGEIENDGFIYTSQQIQTTGDGTVFLRQDLSYNDFELEYDSVDYNGGENTPDVSFADAEGHNIDYFTVTYKNNVNAGTAAVALDLENGKFDETFALPDNFELPFTIERAVKEYNEASLQNLQALLDSKNYYKILFTRQTVAFQNDTITVPEDTILDFGLATISFQDNAAKEASITLGKGAEIWVGANSAARFNDKYISIANRIYFTQNFGEGQTINLFSNVDKDSYPSTVSGGEKYALVVDLNGYTFSGKMNVRSAVGRDNIPIAVNLTIMDSSAEKTGCLGSETSEDYALDIQFNAYYSYGTRLNVVNIEGIKIAGASIVKDKNDTIKIKDCTFVKRTAVPALYIDGYNNADNNGSFENCIFEGETAVYLENNISNLNFVGCTFIGSGEFSSNYHGAAIYANALSKTMSVALTGGTIKSEKGNGIEIYKGPKSYFTISKDVVYEVAGDKDKIVTLS